MLLLGLNHDGTPAMFGLETYCEQYGRMSENVYLGEDHEELSDWHVRVPFNKGEVKVLCCPEDMSCNRVGGTAHCNLECCEDCVAPICKECKTSLDAKTPSLPPSSLCNDMMIYYAPSMLYKDKVTVMEMICASVCTTSMICFTVEKKLRNIRSLDGDVHANTHRMAARGNATSFPLPWEDLLMQLRTSDRCASAGAGIPLPRAGVELANVVSILLETAGGDDDGQASALFIHQATVRRQVVINLIEELKRRGHNTYVNVDLRCEGEGKSVTRK